MAKTQGNRSLTFTNVEPMKPSPQAKCTNVRTFKGVLTVEGQKYEVLLPVIFLGRKPAQAAMKGQPWSTPAELFSWSQKRPGKATLLTGDGELSGLRLQVQVAEYHAELDTRPAPSKAEAATVGDDLGDII